MESRVRASPEQFSTLLEYMETHGDLARPLAGSQGRVRSDRLWTELTNILNAVGGGVSKTTDKWKKVWADWKSKTKKKALTIRHHARGTGGGPASGQTLSAGDERVLAIMGALAVAGQVSVEELGFNRPLNTAQDDLVTQDDSVYLEIVDAEDFTKCRQKDSKLNECLKMAVPDALRRMKKGIPSLSVPEMEPLHVNSINVDSGSGPVVITQMYKNIKLHGLTDSVLTLYKADLRNYRLRTDSITPKMEFIADYIMRGRILLLPIQGKGIANITMVNLVVKHDLIGEPVVKDGETYMHIKDYRVKFIPQRVLLHFTNLFNGDKVLGDNMNEFLNSNSDLVFSELKESYEKALSSVFQNVTNEIFDKVPMNKIFLED